MRAGDAGVSGSARAWTARVRAAVLAVTCALASCGDDAAAGAGPMVRTDGGMFDADGGTPGGFFPVAEAADPCAQAGYVFDRRSACDEVRCPELGCECPEIPSSTPGASLRAAETIALTGCVPASGCLDVVDCNRVCDPATALARDACEARIDAAASLACAADEDCPGGTCREERVGAICIDLLGCAESGHCGDGSACLFDPDSLDPITSSPTALGACADGAHQSLCYEDADCVYGMCLGERCSGGLDGERCVQNRHCASGHCRIVDPLAGEGSCVSGDAGSGCVDQGDCDDGLHCTGGTCFTDAVGETCDADTQCASGSCVYGRCRGGELASFCEDDGDCTDGFCVGGRCASGTVLAPCTDAGDCKGGLACVQLLCVDGSLGMPCYEDTDCETFSCARGACSAGENGDECDEPADCTSGRCADPAGVEPGVCTSGDPGSPCAYATHCKSNSCLVERCE